MLRQWGTTSHRHEGLLLARPSRLFRHVAMTILEHGQVATSARSFWPPTSASTTSLLPAKKLTRPESLHCYVHPPSHSPLCRALRITRCRFQRQQMRQSKPSTMASIAPRPLPNAIAWDTRQGLGTGMYGPLVPLLHPDHWVGPSTTRSRPPPTTSVNCPCPTQQKTLCCVRAAWRILSLVHG